MGATTYTIKTKGTNVKDIFNFLVEDAIYDYGNDSYNGTISTTSLGDEINIPNNVIKNEAKLNDFINDDKNDNMLFPSKRQTTYVNLGPSHYEAFTPTWIEDVETPRREKGVTTLQSFSMYIKGESQIRQRFSSLSEAKRSAKEYSLILNKDITIYKHRSNGNRFTLGHFELTSDHKEYKSARKATKTKIYKPINEYIFFVYAAC